MKGYSGSSCGACKFLRRKCAADCVFAPHFSYEEAATHFAAVHRVFGASNVSKLLLHLPAERRGEAAATVAYQALARMRDPIYGCVAYIFALQQQVANLQEEINEVLGNQMMGSSMDEIAYGNATNDGIEAQEEVDLLFQRGKAAFGHVNFNHGQTGLQFPPEESCLGSQNAVWDFYLSYLEGVPRGMLGQQIFSQPLWFENSSSS